MKSLKEFINPDVKLSPSDQQEKDRIMRGMVKSNRDELVRRYGADVAKVINGRANNLLKTKRTKTLQTIQGKGVDDLISKSLQKTPKPTTTPTPSTTTPDIDIEPETPTVDIEPETPEVDVEPENDTQDMENNMDKVDEMISDALKNPKKADLNKDGKLSDYEKKRGAAIEKAIQKEDLDLGHEDNEPHMLKADLYRIGKYAMELYKMVDQFEGQGEVDFPSWWQSKVFKAKEALISAKHYLDFELKEPQIDAMVGVATDTGAIDEATEIYAPKKRETFNIISAFLKFGEIENAHRIGEISIDDFLTLYAEGAFDDTEFGTLGIMDAEKVLNGFAKNYRFFEVGEVTDKLEDFVTFFISDKFKSTTRDFDDLNLNELVMDYGEEENSDRYTIQRNNEDEYQVIDTKTDKIVKSGLHWLKAAQLRDKLNNYKDVGGGEPWRPDPEVDSNPGQPLGLAEKLAKQLKSPVDEKLTKRSSLKKYIDDFESSDAPQFKGKSKNKKIDMAVAAYLSKQKDK